MSERWRADAEVFRRYGYRRMAANLERLADEIDQEVRQELYVDLAEAQELTGYTRGHLRRLMRENIFPNYGTEAAPRFLLSELPRKPGFHREIVPASVITGMSGSEIARAVIGGAASDETRWRRRR